jgi:signal-transduction protein with cAMP-binding, CBS, and nucleotidyltransferase domain
MPVEASKELIDTIRQIPLFMDLTVAQVRKLLALCQSRTYQAEEKLCLRDNSNGEMYILITGEWAVVTDEGGHIDTVEPVMDVPPSSSTD